MIPLSRTKRIFRISATACTAAAASAAAGFAEIAAPSAPQPLLQSFEQDIQPMLDRYCYDCHGYGSDKGGVVLDGFEDDVELRDYTLWHRAFKNLQGGLMPPNDEAQPSAEQKEKILSWIKVKAFQLDPEHPDPGQVTLRRLNRVEYRNTIQDLLGYDYDTSVEFPADDTGHGFDNNGDVLTISPMLLEKYLDAAQKIVSASVPRSSRAVAVRKIPGRDFEEQEGVAQSESKWAKHLSYYEPASVTATRRVEHAGEYQVALDMAAIESYVDNQFDLNEARFVFKIDGETALDRKFVREGWKNFEFVFDRVWEPGEHSFTIEVEPLTPDRERLRKLRFQINQVTVRGPMDETHWVRPDNYAKFFPRDVPSSPEDRKAYARELLSDFGRKAFRRPVDARTVERLAELAEFSASGEGETFESGIAQAMTAILASPRFIFREEDTLPLEPGEKHPKVDEWALASRLSYFLWSTMPDEELFRLAAENRLREQLKLQVQRMIAHEKANGFVKNFVGQWLQARDITSVPISDFAVWLRENPNPELAEARETFRRIREIDEELRTEEQEQEFQRARQAFFSMIRQPRPELGRELREAMLSETEMLFQHIVDQDRSLVELIDSDYTFLNQELAEHYGIEGVEGEEMRKVTLPPDSPRGGVLTQGTVLAVTSNPTRTSPVKRGVFILDNILGAPPPPPPPNIPSLEDAASEEELANMSLRETLALHARKRTCRSCHVRMDPLGLALENFNAMGRWRDSEMNQPIEPEGQLITGESFADIRELKRILANERRTDFYRCLSEKLLTYALGRGVEYYDVDTIDQLVTSLEQSGGRASSLIMGIIESPAFQKKRNPELHPTETETLARDEEHRPELANLR